MENWKNSPFLKKAIELQHLTDSIVEIVKESDMNYETEEEGNDIDTAINVLTENSIYLVGIIKFLTFNDTPYDLKMENATMIRKSALEQLEYVDILEKYGFEEIEYLDVFRKEIDLFRVLFAEWVKTFDCWNYTIDRWGLFNPPGVNYDDDQDDLPSNFDDDPEDLDD